MHNPVNLGKFPLLQIFLLFLIFFSSSSPIKYIYHTFCSCPTVPGYSVLFSEIFAFYFSLLEVSIVIFSSPESLWHVHSTK